MDELDREINMGDSVAVRSGVDHPQLDYDISGWQGRVIEIETGRPNAVLVAVEWDSLTLRNAPSSFIEEADEAGIDWTQANLLPEALVPTIPRDDEEDVTRTAAELSERYETAGYEDEATVSEVRAQEHRVKEALSGAHSLEEKLERWHDYFLRNVEFPFQAEVIFFQDRGPLQEGDVVNVEGVSLLDGEHGLIVSVAHEGNYYDFPLSDLEVTDQNSATFELVDDYSFWYDSTRESSE